ncbi:hypothetical protein A2V71_03545 [Candidatus Berkelbacteria bacterium RBG_13_40_8]|uniref:Uncharacterized protein n=1 Tax=Candidatus Berkelbacteria bacterium RBG_13_40_8 TaxID=1797467 RepID=A0A1F5DNF4_9BACT|nr:MAG: hypothetical protein A2V71_03545 [Candidatus Berkelbacteria bacterium RBG_13_40_8]
MKKTVFLLVLMLLVISALASYANPKSVIIVPTVMTGEEREPNVASIDPLQTKIYENAGLVVIHGAAAVQILKDMGIEVTPEGAMDDNTLLAIGHAANANYVAGSAIGLQSSYHILWRKGRCDFSTLVMNVDTGEVVDRVVGKEFAEKYQNNEAIAAKGTGLVLGVTVASGALPHLTHWGNNHPAAYLTSAWVLGAGALASVPSRCKVQQKSLESATTKVLGPIAQKMK